MFKLWLVTLMLGPIVFAAVAGYFWRRHLARPRLYFFIGTVGLWCIAFVVAYRVLSGVGVSGGAPSGVDNGESYLGASLLVFLLATAAFLVVLRFCMPKRVL
jgi:hypothetical protein